VHRIWRACCLLTHQPPLACLYSIPTCLLSQAVLPHPFLPAQQALPPWLACTVLPPGFPTLKRSAGPLTCPHSIALLLALQPPGSSQAGASGRKGAKRAMRERALKLAEANPAEPDHQRLLQLSSRWAAAPELCQGSRRQSGKVGWVWESGMGLGLSRRTPQS